MLLQTISDGYVNSKYITNVKINRNVEGKFQVCVRLLNQTDYKSLVVCETERQAKYFVRQLGQKVKSLKVADEEDITD